MPNRIPTPGVSTPAVRKSPAAHPAVKPVENASSINAKRNATMKINKPNLTIPAPKKSKSASNYPADPTKVKGFQFGGGTV